MKDNQIKLLDELNLFHIPISAVEGKELIGPGGKRYVDFCSTNYLSLEHHTHLEQKGLEFHRRWGSLPGWSRMEADPDIYRNLEKRLAGFLNADQVMLMHTITLMNVSILPGIVQKGVVFTDHELHTVVWEACRLARDHGAKIVRYRHQDMDDLETKLKENASEHPKVIAVDGVYSISTELSPIRALQALADKYEAWLYVDDAHGFGILGEQPSAKNLWGIKGSGIVNHFGGNHRRTFYVSSFGKAFCAYTAFATIPSDYKDNIRAFATSYLFSGPITPFIIGMTEAALDLNDSIGEAERIKLQENTRYFLTGLHAMGLATKNHLHQPVIFVEVGKLQQLAKVGQALAKEGILPGYRAYPVVPADSCGLRFTLTSGHERRHIDAALESLRCLV